MNMGQYLATGLTVSLFVKKNYKDVELSQINTAISSLYPLELFTEDHQERHFCWFVKPSLLEDRFSDFIRAYLTLYGDSPEKIDKLITALDSCHSIDEMATLAQNKSFYNFRWDEYGQPFYLTLPYDKRLELLHIDIALTMDGKIITEGISQFLTLTTSCLRKTFAQYPPAAVLNAYLTG